MPQKLLIIGLLVDKELFVPKIYYDPETSGFYQDDVHKIIPPSAIEITDQQRWELLAGQTGKNIAVVDGDVVLSDVVKTIESIFQEERDWRDNELQKADIELYKVQDSDPKSRGTVTQWREYRKSLRAWPDNKNFPNKEYRPTSPDS